MNQKTFAAIAGILFFVIALLHLARIIVGWDAMINGMAIPEWASLLGVIAAGSLSYCGLRLSGLGFSVKKHGKKY